MVISSIPLQLEKRQLMINLGRRGSKMVSLQSLPAEELGPPNTSTMAILTKLSDSFLEVTTHLQVKKVHPKTILYLF